MISMRTYFTEAVMPQREASTEPAYHARANNGAL